MRNVVGAGVRRWSLRIWSPRGWAEPTPASLAAGRPVATEAGGVHAPRLELTGGADPLAGSLRTFRRPRRPMIPLATPAQSRPRWTQDAGLALLALALSVLFFAPHLWLMKEYRSEEHTSELQSPDHL